MRSCIRDAQKEIPKKTGGQRRAEKDTVMGDTQQDQHGEQKLPVRDTQDSEKGVLVFVYLFGTHRQ